MDITSYNKHSVLRRVGNKNKLELGDRRNLTIGSATEILITNYKVIKQKILL